MPIFSSKDQMTSGRLTSALGRRSFVVNSILQMMMVGKEIKKNRQERQRKEDVHVEEESVRMRDVQQILNISEMMK